MLVMGAGRGKLLKKWEKLGRREKTRFLPLPADTKRT